MQAFIHPFKQAIQQGEKDALLSTVQDDEDDSSSDVLMARAVRYLHNEGYGGKNIEGDEGFGPIGGCHQWTAAVLSILLGMDGVPAHMHETAFVLSRVPQRMDYDTTVSPPQEPIELPAIDDAVAEVHARRAASRLDAYFKPQLAHNLCNVCNFVEGITRECDVEVLYGLLRAVLPEALPPTITPTSVMQAAKSMLHYKRLTQINWYSKEQVAAIQQGVLARVIGADLRRNTGHADSNTKRRKRV